MDERTLLQDQIAALAQQLGRVEVALDLPQIDEDLRKRVRYRFDQLINKRRRALKAVETEVAGGQPLDACWPAFRAVSQDCAVLFHEALAFAQGVLARSVLDKDLGLCRIADGLLADLSERADQPWDRLTILDTGEFFADVSGIIRVRYPEVSIWNLPVAAHELGHFLGRAWEDRAGHSYRTLLTRERQRGLAYADYRLHEHFADLFATYTLGPAFACTCLLARFDPGTAGQDDQDKQHPNDGKRAYVILQTLDRMDKAAGGLNRAYRDINVYLDGLWRQSVTAAGGTPLPPDTVVALDAVLDDLYGLVEDDLPDKARYRPVDWLRAQRLAAALPADARPARFTQSDDTLRDVLNAAWIGRIDGGNRDRIEERALTACGEILRRR